MAGQGSLSTNLLLVPRQPPFLQPRMLAIQQLRGHHPEHRIPEVLEPLVVLVASALVGVGAMRERQLEQVAMPEAMAEPFFEGRGRPNSKHGSMLPENNVGAASQPH